MPSLKVNAITSVTNCGDVIDPADFDWAESGYIELQCAWWTCRPRQIVVALNHGFDEIPDDLVEVAVSIAARASSSPSGAVQESTGPFSVRWSTTAGGVAGGVALLEHERAILDKYKLPPRA